MRKILLPAGLALSLLLCGCQQQPMTHDYLMEHPSELEAKVAACNGGSVGANLSCDVVHQAAQEFMQLVNDHNNDPEKFGKQIIEIQAQMAQLDSQSDQQEKYQQLKHELRTRYAVIAATTTE